MESQSSQQGNVATERLLYLYEECGWSVRQIAEMVGLPRGTIHGRLKRAGVEFRGKGGAGGGGQQGPSHADLQKAVFLYTRLEWTIKEVADHFERHPSTVRHWIGTLAGIPIRNRHIALRMANKRRQAQAA